MIEETRAKISATMKGRAKSLDARRRMSAAHKGAPSNFLGHHHSVEAKAKNSSARLGLKASPETREKMSASHWKGGAQVSSRKSMAKRRAYGFVPLNKPFFGCEGHHVDVDQVIYVPKELHRSVFHRQSGGRGMAKINAIAYNFLFRQEAEAALVKEAL
jgi:hypothetical protein